MITLRCPGGKHSPLNSGYLDPNAYKKGKGKATSQIELRSQNGQSEQRSYANSTLNITNGEAVSHHYSYDRQAEKEMGSTTRTAKTQKQRYSCPFCGGTFAAFHSV